MQRARILVMALSGKALTPAAWTSLPRFILSIGGVIETDLPVWQWPRLLFARLRSFVFGIDNRTITRAMVTPFSASGGAQVLRPNWDLIRPRLRGRFGWF